MKSEEIVLNALLLWLEVNEAYKDKAAELFEHVVWADVPDEALAKLREQPKLWPVVEKHRQSSKEIIRVRGCNEWIVVIGFDSRTLEYLDISNTSRGWLKLAEIPGKRMRYGMSGAGLACDGDRIYVNGGVGGKGGILQAVGETLVYEIKTNSWSVLSSQMNKARKCHGFALTDKKLYVVGGIDSQLSVSTAESYDLANGVSTVPISSSQSATSSNWQTISSPSSMSHCSGTNLIPLRTNVLVALSAYGTVEHDRIFHTDSKTWEPLPKGRIPRDRPGVGQHEGKLVIAGGSAERELLNTVEMFDLVTGNWSELSPLAIKREGPAVVSSGGKLWVIGGKTSDGEESGTVETLDGSHWTVHTLKLNHNVSQECSATVVKCSV